MFPRRPDTICKWSYTKYNPPVSVINNVIDNKFSICMYAPRGAGQNVAPSSIFKTSPICVNEVKYLRQVLYVYHELYKCSKKVLCICKMLCLFGNKLDISTSSCIYMKQVLHIKKKSYLY